MIAHFRLTSIYGLILLFRASLYKFVPEGPTNIIPKEIEDCKEVMWEQFAYVNNFKEDGDVFVSDIQLLFYKS